MGCPRQLHLPHECTLIGWCSLVVRDTGWRRVASRSHACRFQGCELPVFMTTQHETVQLQRTHRNRNQACLASITAHLEAMQLGRVHVNTVAPGHCVHIDILLPDVACGGKSVAISLLSAHDTATNTGQPLGHWLLRRRLIESCGVHVLSVADDVWESSTAPDVMLRNLLQDCTFAKK